jgi:hypothetical protein
MNTLLELCKVLGWQGGTIHQIKDVLRLAKRACDAHVEAEICGGDWEEFKAAIYALIKAVR